jgi:sugar phosphate isomerase/epimerase
MNRARVIFSTGSLYLLDLAHCFELAAETGFDGVEVMCDERWSTRDPSYLNRLSERYALPIQVLHTPFSDDAPGWQRPHDPLSLVTQTLKLAQAVGAESIVVHLPLKAGRITVGLPQRRLFLPWFSPFGGVKRWLAEDLGRAQPHIPVNIAIENMPARQRWGRRLDPAWWNTVEAWSRVHTRLTMDTTHLGTFGIDPLEAYLAAKDNICHVHLSNFDGREHRLPHKGRLNLAGLLTKMAEDGFAGTISLELHPDALEFDDHHALTRNLRESLAFCKEHLAGQTAPALRS